MSIKDEHPNFRNGHGLKNGNFEDRVKLQNFLRDRLDDIWREFRGFSNGGLYKNDMTGFAIGFAYYAIASPPSSARKNAMDCR